MKTALALGSFDGVHIAHRSVLNLPEDCEKVAITFLKPPKMVLEGKDELLMTLDDRISVIKSMGYSEVFCLDFNVVKNTQAIDFLEFLLAKYNPSVIACGFNYHFGKGGKGDRLFLEEFCAKRGIELRVSERISVENQAVSSTLIREKLKDGHVEEAAALMPIPFSFTAEVIKGDRRGRTIGFPTINQKYPEDLVKVKFGVYKVKVIANGNEYDGICNIGIRPSFESDYVISETYIKDFSGDLYGKKVKIIPQMFLREEKKFASLEQLKKQIESDINQIK